eukprot:9320358-Pyramimonas_sp.AAC.1
MDAINSAEDLVKSPFETVFVQLSVRHSAIVPLQNGGVLRSRADHDLDDGLAAVADDACATIGTPAARRPRAADQLEEALGLDLAADGLGGLVQPGEDADIVAIDRGRGEAPP